MSDLEDLYELSPMQQGILFHSLAASDPGVYLIELRYTLQGRLDIEALERAWQWVVDRTPILRTSFHWEEIHKPLQAVHREVRLALERHDWRGLPEVEQEGRLSAYLEADRVRAFALDRPPLTRVALIRTAEDRHHLVWTFHHILLEGWSASLVLEDVFAFYRAYARGRDIDLPPRPPYRDYILWLQRQDLSKTEAYWREALRGFSTPTTPGVPDSSRNSASGGQGYGRECLRLPVATSKALESLARRNQLTLNTVLQGAWAILVSRYCGQQDVLYGSVVSGRQVDLPGVDSIIGLFVNTLPARVRVGPGDRLLEWLKKLQDQHIEMRRYEYSSLREVQGWSEVPRGTPLFESLFGFENWPGDLSLRRCDEDLEVSGFRTVEGGTDYPLVLEAAGNTPVSVVFTYDRRRFDAATIGRMSGHYESLLEGMAAHPDARLSDLPLLGEAERRQLVVGWNQTAVEYASDFCVHELFERQVEQRPDAVAMTFGDERLSYGELNRRANQLARHLRRLGVGPEVVVGLCLERSAEMVVALLGILKAGGAYLPLDPAYPAEQLTFMVSDARMPVLLTQERLVGKVPEGGTRVMCLDRDWATVAKEGEEDLESGVVPENLAYVIYTSGSTGRPKGVAAQHGGLLNLVRWHQRVYQVRAGDRATQLAGPAFDASVWELWPYLTAGASIHIPDEETRLSPGTLRSWLAAEGITLSFLPTPLAEGVLKEPGLEKLSLRALLTGGDKLHRVLGGSLPFRLVNHYGPTEGTVVATCGEVVVGGEWDPPIGRPIDNTRTYVLDRQLSPVPVGVGGELYIAGDGLARGYLGRPELTAERFVPDPFSEEGGGRLYWTGDVVRYLADANIEFLGRVDNQVKVRGFRIELGEIESVLGRHPAVQDAVVMVREDHPGDRRLAAYVTARTGQVLDADELRSHMEGKLPEYMVPSAFVLLESLPLTANGKVDRRSLPSPSGRSSTEEAFVPPRNEVEERIAALWRETLHLEKVGIHDNFFDQGGHSLLLVHLQGKLEQMLEREVPIVDLFRYPTIHALAEYLRPRERPVSPLDEVRSRVDRRREGGVRDDAVAVIGLAGRFPRAKDVEELWSNLCQGRECITFFSEEDLAAAGIEPQMLRHPNYVKARGVLEGAELFDASFFGYSPREAEVMDPQQRVFLETAWEALEDAGWDPARYRGLIGVYGGTATTSYLVRMRSGPEIMESVGSLATVIGGDKDFLATRVSYKLNLRGPSVNVQTACSTSLVAVHLACQSLIQHECDIALAGGVAVGSPQKAGYLYQEEGIASPDGHCRAFDARARGTVGGSGAGIVVLKRLQDALAEGDSIRAVIKGSAINNDGSAKVGYTAPGVQGQAEVIAMAQAVAAVEPETIGYVEAHGTGTALGDPIEITALTQVFRMRTERKGFCAVGSVKTNLGHLDAAAGVTGLIKTVLALERRLLPPSLHFEEPNPKIDFAASPFFVNTALTAWAANGSPRRAGVSSFGIGGTNAHVVLEEAPARAASCPSRPVQVLLLSAKSEAALDAMTARLGAHLGCHPELDLSDVAYTLQVGRSELDWRRAVVCSDVDEAVAALEGREPRRVLDAGPAPSPRRVAFLFPGQGAQHSAMGRGLYQGEPRFREVIDRCAELLRPGLGVDLRDVLYPAAGEEKDAADRLRQTRFAQPALFAVEYALAGLWMGWGVRPEAMIGHSVGEYVAACVAEVLSLEDALALMVARGELMQGLPEGGMLAVPLPEKELRTLLDGELAVAATNGPTLCVASGPFEAIDRLEKALSEQGVETRRLHTSHAFHSAAMDPILRAFTERVARVRLQSPRIPYASNVTGTWIRAEEATDPAYWAKHLRRTVCFAEGVGELLSRPELVLLEVGPGQTLSGLARQHPLAGADRIVVASARSPLEDRPDQEVLLNALARLWLSGVAIDWRGYYEAERRRRVPLPTYPFERQRFWIDTLSSAPRRGLGKKVDIGDWFYVPTWKAAGMPRCEAPASRAQPTGPWLIFTPALGLGSKLVSGLEAAGSDVLTVRPGERFIRSAERVWEVDPGRVEDYRSLIAEVLARGPAPAGIAHLWSLSADGEGSAVDGLEASKRLGFYSLLFLAQALSRLGVTQPLQLAVVSSGVRDVSGAEATVPEKALLLGACRVMPQEHPNVTCRSIDVVLPPPGSAAEDVLLEQLLAELTGVHSDLDVAYRGLQRWAEGFQALRLDAPEGRSRVRHRGSYLITGGLGGVGLALAEHLARTAQARLALVGRTAVPSREEWERRLAEQPDTDPVRRRIAKLRELESLGAEVLCLRADVADERQMREALSRAEAAFGPLRGVIHAAGITDRSTLRPLSELDVAQCEDQFRPKVEGLLVLERLLGAKDLDFCLLTSSLSTVLGGLGLGAYAAANHFMDAFAHDRNRRYRRPWIVVDWDGWNLSRPAGPATGAAAFSMDAEEGVETFARALSASVPLRLVVSTADLAARIERWVGRVDGPADDAAGRPAARTAHVRTANAPYVAPRNDTEAAVAAIWQALFGIDEIGIHDNFFDLGGHSLLALQLTARLRELAHVEVKLQDVFNAPTVSELAALIGSSSVAADDAVAKFEDVLRMVEDLPEAEVQALLSAAAEGIRG